MSRMQHPNARPAPRGYPKFAPKSPQPRLITPRPDPVPSAPLAGETEQERRMRLIAEANNLSERLCDVLQDLHSSGMRMERIISPRHPDAARDPRFLPLFRYEPA